MPCFFKKMGWQSLLHGKMNPNLTNIAQYKIHYSSQYYTALFSITLPFTVLHCTAVSCTVLHCTALHCTAQYYTVLQCPAQYCTVLHCTALHCTVLHWTAVHSSALHCTLGPWRPPGMFSSPVYYGLFGLGAERTSHNEGEHDTALWLTIPDNFRYHSFSSFQWAPNIPFTIGCPIIPKWWVGWSLIVANAVSIPRECFPKISEFIKRNWPGAARI